MLRLYGLTGGMGSGKSEAARCFERGGVPVIHADELGHAALAPGGAAEAAVLRAFGAEIAPEGVIDRSALARVVFADRDALHRLNALVHPVVRDGILAQAESLTRQGAFAAMVEAALWAEDGKKEDWMTGLVLVAAPLETRLARLRQQRGMTLEQAQERIAMQTDPEKKRPLADWVIENNGSVEDMQRQVDAIIEALRESQAD